MMSSDQARINNQYGFARSLVGLSGIIYCELLSNGQTLNLDLYYQQFDSLAQRRFLPLGDELCAINIMPGHT